MENYYQVEEVYGGLMFWDLHKDVYGCKPHRHEYYAKSTSEERRKELLARLDEDFEAQQKQYRIQRTEQTKKLDEEIQALVDHARVSSRKEAILFLYHLEEYHDAWHFVYTYNLEDWLENEIFTAILGGNQ